MCPPGMQAAIEQAALIRGIPVERLEIRPGMDLAAPFIVGKHLVRSAPDVVHSHGYKANVLTALARPRPAVPVVATLHGWVSKGQCNRNSFYEWLDRRLLFLKDAVVPVARAIQEDPYVRRHRSVTVIPNGVDWGPLAVEATDLELAPLIEFCRRAPTIIVIGRLSPEKNQTAAIRAIATLRGRGENVQLLVVGEGPLRNELLTLVQSLDLANDVCLAGYVRDPSRLFRYVRGLLLTSLTEGTPIAVLEAMRDRVPIISTAVGDVPELTVGKKGGWLVETAEEDALATVIGTVLNDAAAAEGRTLYSRERWETCYTLARMAERYAEVYARCRAS